MGLVSEARSIIASWKPHLLLVSIDVEDGHARQLLDAADSKEGPAIIALTRRGDLPGKLAALDRGADDYINVPLEPSDLIARTHEVLRRAHKDPGGITSRLRVADLELDVLRRVVAAQGLVLHLTSLEQALLYLFAANADAVLTREQILDAIWGTDFVSEERFVDRYVRALRTKLQHNSPKARFIETVPGVGYRFVPRQPAGAPKRATRQEPARTRDVVAAANRRRRPSAR